MTRLLSILHFGTAIGYEAARFLGVGTVCGLAVFALGVFVLLKVEQFNEIEQEFLNKEQIR